MYFIFCTSTCSALLNMFDKERRSRNIIIVIDIIINIIIKYKDIINKYKDIKTD